MVRDINSVIPFNTSASPSWKEPDSIPLSSQRPLLHKISYPPRVTMNGLLLSALCTVLLVFISYLALSFPSPLNLVTKEALLMDYTFLLPLTLFVGALLGP